MLQADEENLFYNIHSQKSHRSSASIDMSHDGSDSHIAKLEKTIVEGLL